jgi:hypothetical protein
LPAPFHLCILTPVQLLPSVLIAFAGTYATAWVLVALCAVSLALFSVVYTREKKTQARRMRRPHTAYATADVI